MLRVFVLCFLFSFTASVNAGAIVVHKDNDSVLVKEDIVQIFLLQVETFPNGTSAIPVDQIRQNQVRNRFTNEVLDSTLFRLRAHYSKLLFTGKGRPPIELKSDQDVITQVASNPRLIGYVSTVPDNRAVKVIFRF